MLQRLTHVGIEASLMLSKKVLPQEPASADPKCKSDASNQRLEKDGSFFAQFCDKIVYIYQMN